MWWIERYLVLCFNCKRILLNNMCVLNPCTRHGIESSKDHVPQYIFCTLKLLSRGDLSSRLELDGEKAEVSGTWQAVHAHKHSFVSNAENVARQVWKTFKRQDWNAPPLDLQFYACFCYLLNFLLHLIFYSVYLYVWEQLVNENSLIPLCELGDVPLAWPPAPLPSEIHHTACC